MSAENKQIGLAEHPAHAGARDAVDDREAQRSHHDQDDAERRSLVGAAGDVEGEDPDR